MAQTFLGPGFVKIADVDVARGTTTDGQRNSRRQSTRVLAPANLETTVVNHEALKVAQSIERSGSCGINKGDEADVFVGDVSNMMQQSTTNNVANLFDCCLRVDVTQIDGAVPQVVESSGCGGNSGGSNRLLGQRVGDHIAVGASQHVRIARSNSEILGGVLLLSLGDIRATVLTVVDAARRLPLGLLG